MFPQGWRNYRDWLTHLNTTSHLFINLTANMIFLDLLMYELFRPRKTNEMHGCTLGEESAFSSYQSEPNKTRCRHCFLLIWLINDQPYWIAEIYSFKSSNDIVIHWISLVLDCDWGLNCILSHQYFSYQASTFYIMLHDDNFINF